MGTPDFSVPVLKALVAEGHEIACVYSQPPRPAGRGKKLRPAPVHAAAEALGLLVRHPKSFKDPETLAAFVALDAEVAVVVAYGLILPQSVLNAPRHGCVNIHASLLPRWRGAAPIHRAIMAGDAETGICIIQMVAGLDTGPVLARCSTAIGTTETTGELHDRLVELGAGLIVDTLRKLPNLAAVAQPKDGVVYARKIDRAESAINWSAAAQTIDRQIRALAPFPGAWTLIDGVRIKLLGSACVAGAGVPGHVLDDALTIACGTGALRVTRLQRAGKEAQDSIEFLRGWPVPAGTKLGV